MSLRARVAGEAISKLARRHLHPVRAASPTGRDGLAHTCLICDEMPTHFKNHGSVRFAMNCSSNSKIGSAGVASSAKNTFSQRHPTRSRLWN
jgi:hypothetical protein